MNQKDNWSRYESVGKMVERITGPRRQGSPLTALSYVYGLRRFCMFIGYEDPDKLLSDIKNGRVNPVEKIDKFIDEELGKGKASQTVLVKIMAVKRWLIVNGVKVDLNEIEMPKQEVLEEDRAPIKEELKRIFSNLSVRNRAMAYVGVSSGLRLGTLTGLRWGEVDLDRYDDVGKIVVRKAAGRKMIGKMNFYVTWITPEAKAVLREWRGYYAKMGGKTGPEDRVWGARADSFNDSWILALKKSGLAERKRRMHELHFHTLRKFFRTQCENAGVKRSYWEFWMGHKGQYLDEAYFRAQEKEHLEEYRKAVPCLTVETNEAELTKSIKEMEERQKMERKALLDRIAALEGEREKAMTITRETIEDVKRIKEEMLKAKGDGEGKCEDRENCQKVIGEAELETWLAKGWEAKIVLPSEKIVIER